MDFIRAKGPLRAGLTTAPMPIVGAPQIGLKNARHTLLAQTLRREGKPIVPLELTLSASEAHSGHFGPERGRRSPFV